MRIVWLLAAVVAVVAAFLLGMASQRVVPVAGVARPTGNPNLAVLTLCRWSAAAKVAFAMVSVLKMPLATGNPLTQAPRRPHSASVDSG